MVRVPDLGDRGTGAGGNSTATASRSSRDQGRRLALRVALDEDSGQSVAADGGLSQAALAWMDATPGADLEDARRYDQEHQLYRDLSRSGPLPPRGKSGGPENYTRSEIINTARQALRQYHDLEDGGQKEDG